MPWNVSIPGHSGMYRFAENPAAIMRYLDDAVLPSAVLTCQRPSSVSKRASTTTLLKAQSFFTWSTWSTWSKYRPILPGLGNRVPVLWDFRVHRGSWITVPAPGAADIIARFVYDGLETQLTHLVKAVDAAEAGSHDDDIDAEVISVGSSRASKGGIFAKFLPDMHVEIALESVTFQLRCSRT